MNDVECIAKSCVRIHDQGQLHRLRDGLSVSRDVIQADEAQVGHGVKGIGETCPTQIHGLKAERVNHARGQRVGRAWDHEAIFLL